MSEFKETMSDVYSTSVSTETIDEALEILAAEVATNYANTIEFTARLAKIYDFEFAAFWQPVAFTESRLYEEERRDERLKDVTLGKLYRSVRESIRTRCRP